MNNPKFGAITSSTNPDEIANRVKGAVLAAAGIIMFVAFKWFNIELTMEDVGVLATQLSVAAGALWSLYGFGLWVLARFFQQEV